MAGWTCEWAASAPSSCLPVVSGLNGFVFNSMVNNAGIAPEIRGFRPIHETDDSIFDSIMAVNSRGVFLGCKYAARQMITQDPHPSGDRGWIINIASIAGLVGVPGAVSYNASKASVIQISRTVALDLAQWRIHCNAICPGCELPSAL